MTLPEPTRNKPSIEIYAEGNYNFAGYKPPTYNGAPLYDYSGKHSIFDMGLDVRFFFGQSRFKAFVEGGAGMYMLNYPPSTYTLSYIAGDTLYINMTKESSSSVGFGTHAGFGGIYNLANNVNLYIRSDIRAMLGGSDQGIKSKIFFGVYAGAKFGF